MSDRGAGRDSGGKKKGGPPPLAWLIVGLLLVIGAWFLLNRDGAMEPASGGPAMPVDSRNEPTVVEPAVTPGPATPPG